MGTYNYGNNSCIVYTLKDVAPYNILENLGNTGEEVKPIIPNDFKSDSLYGAIEIILEMIIGKTEKKLISISRR